MSGQSKIRTRYSRWLLVALIACLGVALSVSGFFVLRAREASTVQAELRLGADQRIRALERRFRAAIGSVSSLSLFFQESGAETPEEFRTVAQRCLTQNHENVAVVWLPRVPAERRGEHEAAAQLQGSPEYRISMLTEDGGRQPAPALPQGEDYFPIEFIETSGRRAAWLGVDLGCSPEHRLALTHSAETDEVAITLPIRWDQDDESRVLLVLLPMYSGVDVDDTPQTRREKLQGFLGLAVRLDTLLSESLRAFPPDIDLQLYLVSDAGVWQFVYAYQAVDHQVQYAPLEPADSEASERQIREATLEIPGPTWLVDCVPVQASLNNRGSILPMVVLWFGLTLTVLLTTYANTLLGRKDQVEREVIARTAELQEANTALEREATERRRAQEGFALERFLLHTLLEHSPDYIYFKDRDSRYLRISKALADYLGLGTHSDAIGKSDLDVFDTDQAQQYREDERRIMETGQPVLNKEEEQMWPGGRLKWVSTTKVPLRDPSGQVLGTFGISRDITANKHAAAQLQAAKDAAEAASRAKSDFLANMSHEIRTPLHAVIAISELLLDTPLSDSQRDSLKTVLNSGESLLAVINDILDFSKIEAGKLELSPAPFDLRESLGDAIKSLAFRAHTKGLELACRVRPEVPNWLVGDIGRLRQILVNLIGNALKFTDQGEVILHVELLQPGDHEAVLRFTVTDTGIGIPADKQQRIFKAFEQADTSSTRRFGGTGLGLSISSRLVELMGGRIGVESEPGVGSRFHFTVRLQVLEGLPRTAPPVKMAGVHVLVVDDNATNRQILEETLTGWELRPTLAASAAEALAILLPAGTPGPPFALVVTDANMPDMDGFQLVEQIRRAPQLSQLNVIMLTSSERPGDFARCREFRIAKFLPKPVKQSELFDALVLALGTAALDDAPPEPSPRPPASSFGSLRILLAEDSVVNQKVARGILAKHGHQVTVANDGEQAIALVARQTFDLVLMDVQMPNMDGLQATAAIRGREHQTGGHIPIIAMTAHAMKGDREQCLTAGMDEYVSKPIRAQQLLGTIEAVWTKFRTPDTCSGSGK